MSNHSFLNLSRDSRNLSRPDSMFMLVPGTCTRSKMTGWSHEVLKNHKYLARCKFQHLNWPFDRSC
jgi:hypothetical protein